MSLLIPITVESHAGHKADETPRAFSLAGERFPVEEVLDRWYQAGRDPSLPSASYFKVRTADGEVRIIRRDDDSMEWSLVSSHPDHGR